MNEDCSHRCSIAFQDFERTIVDHGTTSVGDGTPTSHDSRGTENEHGMGAQECAFSGFAIHRYDVADADVVGSWPAEQDSRKLGRICTDKSALR
jgi:hypothetical protein